MKTKIVIIGSGSQFTEFFLQELFKFEEFKGITLDMVDRKPKRLEQELPDGVRMGYDGLTLTIPG